MNTDRRNFLRNIGLTAAGGALLLTGHADPTPASGELGAYSDYLDRDPQPAPAAAAAADWAVTEPNILGPYHRRGAPYRAKITPPLAEGSVTLIAGRVWGHDTRKPLVNAVVDIWQADHNGRYDNDDPAKPPAADHFAYRARMLSDEQGRYEYETIMPGRYRLSRTAMRPAHIHYMVSAPGYRTLVTQLYFTGDPHNAKDPFIRPSLIIDLAAVKVGTGSYQRGQFDIILAKA